MSNLALKISPAVLMAIGGLRNSNAKRNTAIFCVGLPELLVKFNISTALRLAHFTSQVAHETDGFNTLEEYASGQAYEGREDLGNTQHGDGKRFKGRGGIQCTGRFNYREFTFWVRKHIDFNTPDFVAHSELLLQAPWAGLCAIWYWETHNLNVLADRDDLYAVTEEINGGRNGINDRRIKLKRAKYTIARLSGELVSYTQRSDNILYRGSKGQAVAKLQSELAALGYHHGSIDGDFGAATEASVKDFQRDHDLTIDGVVGANTFAKIQQVRGAANG